MFGNLIFQNSQISLQKAFFLLVLDRLAIIIGDAFIESISLEEFLDIFWAFGDDFNILIFSVIAKNERKDVSQLWPDIFGHVLHNCEGDRFLLVE